MLRCPPAPILKLALATTLVLGISGSGSGGDLVDRLLHRDSAVEEPLAMKQLAHTIKEIEGALGSNGAIGVKAPDVWGQNRMTKYRAEYDAVMAENKGKFQELLNAAQRRTDVAGLTSAMAISASMTPTGGPLGRLRLQRTGVAGPAGPAAVPVSVNNVVATPPGANAGDGTGAPPTVPDLTDIAARIDAMQKTVLNLPSNIVGFATKTGDSGVGLEPTIRLDEQDRYLNHLNQLRRNSAGDDLTDLPGYGLYLIRMPVSILPGECTRQGKGAVVTVEAKHELTEDLLENTFRDVVCRDVLYRLKEPLLWAYSNERSLREYDETQLAADVSDETFEFNYAKYILQLKKRRLRRQRKNCEELGELEAALAREAELPGGPAAAPAAKVGGGEDEEVQSPAGSQFPPLPSVGFGIRGPNPAGSPQSEINQIVGLPFLVRLARFASAATRSNEFGIDSAIFSWLNSETLNAYRFMRQAIYEADKARSLGSPPSHSIDELFRAREIEKIADAVICRDYGRLIRLRNQFFTRLYFRRSPVTYFDEARYMSGLPEDKEYRIEMDSNAAINLRPADILCFVILVQSILVDRQIKQDMRVLHLRLKNDRDPFPYGEAADWPALDSERGPGLRFYDFRPTTLVQQVFNEYVRRKWPIHVYALDPQVEQQNVLDAYSQRTELQLALSVALSAGKIGFNNATKYARQLDEDLITIGLNRTAVGFGAGRSTFGWQFYPRVQSPPAPSNPARVLGILLYNGTRPDYGLTHRRIEPGQRECVAMIVTPDFVPSIRLTSMANWFGLGKHSEQRLDPDELLRLSRKLQSARCALAATADQGKYRPGELARMADRVDQLENLMPTQDFRVVLPEEGDFSGSEIFSSDAANLSPTLYTWFGEPPTVGKDSQVFLLGKAFSVIESQVIAGGVTAPYELLSRNVIKVTIPASARTVDVKERAPAKCFDVHLATPNGISDFHLLIPAKEEKEPEPAFGYTVETKTLDVTIEYWPATVAPSGQSTPVAYFRGLVAPDSAVKVSLKETAGIVPPAICPTFNFPDIKGRPTAAYRPPHPVPFDPLQNAFVLHDEELSGLAYHVAMAVYGSGIDLRNPPSDFKSLKLDPVKVRPLIGGRWGAEVEANQSLTVNLKFRLGPPPPASGQRAPLLVPPLVAPQLSIPPDGRSPFSLPNTSHPLSPAVPLPEQGQSPAVPPPALHPTSPASGLDHSPVPSVEPILRTVPGRAPQAPQSPSPPHGNGAARLNTRGRNRAWDDLPPLPPQVNEAGQQASPLTSRLPTER
jgi:hypothetical protein